MRYETQTTTVSQLFLGEGDTIVVAEPIYPHDSLRSSTVDCIRVDQSVLQRREAGADREIAYDESDIYARGFWVNKAGKALATRSSIQPDASFRLRVVGYAQPHVAKIVERWNAAVDAWIEYDRCRVVDKAEIEATRTAWLAAKKLLVQDTLYAIRTAEQPAAVL